MAFQPKGSCGGKLLFEVARGWRGSPVLCLRDAEQDGEGTLGWHIFIDAEEQVSSTVDLEAGAGSYQFGFGVLGSPRDQGTHRAGSERNLRIVVRKSSRIVLLIGTRLGFGGECEGLARGQVHASIFPQTWESEIVNQDSEGEVCPIANGVQLSITQRQAIVRMFFSEPSARCSGGATEGAQSLNQYSIAGTTSPWGPGPGRAE